MLRQKNETTTTQNWWVPTAAIVVSETSEDSIKSPVQNQHDSLTIPAENQENSLTIPIKTRNIRKILWGYYAFCFLLLIGIIVGDVLTVDLSKKMNVAIPLSTWTTMIISPLMNLLVMLLCCFFVTKIFKKQQNKPLLTITEEGLSVHSLFEGTGVLRWDEIAEIRVYRFCFIRMLGIVPKDMDAFIARMDKRKWVQRMVRVDNYLNRRIFKPLKIFVAPINLNGNAIPMRLEALLARIAVFDDGRG